MDHLVPQCPLQGPFENSVECLLKIHKHLVELSIHLEILLLHLPKDEDRIIGLTSNREVKLVATHVDNCLQPPVKDLLQVG